MKREALYFSAFSSLKSLYDKKDLTLGGKKYKGLYFSIYSFTFFG